MKILGIDPGSRITGFGLIEANKLKFSYINSGCIRTQGDLNERIITIYEGIKEIITNHEVDIVAVERVFMSQIDRIQMLQLSWGMLEGQSFQLQAAKGFQLLITQQTKLKSQS